MPTARIGFEDSRGSSGRDALVRVGLTLDVRVGFDPAFQPAQPVSAALPDRLYPALVDTGATESCIDSVLAIDLGLPIVDRQIVAGVHGSSPTNLHLAQIYVPHLDFTIYGRFAGVHLAAGGQPHSALLGRTFLQNFTMTYEGRTGEVTISND